MEYNITSLINTTPFQTEETESFQTSIYPKEYSFEDHNFVWQTNITKFKNDETPINTFDNYYRTVVSLENQLIVSQNDKHVTKLDKFQSTSLKSNDPSKIYGQSNCYNLILRDGATSKVTVIKPMTTAEEFHFQLANDKSYTRKALCLFVSDGYLVANLNGESHMLKEGQQLTINALWDENIQLTLMGEGSIVQSEILYSFEYGDLGPIPIPKEPASFEDFKTCVYLANSQFRGAKFFFKRKKEEWLDEELSSKVNLINHIGLTAIVFLIGAAILAFTLKGTFTLPQIGLVVLLWLVIHCLIVAPLIFFVVVPKPVKKHIKKITELTPYERKVYEFEKKYFTRRSAKIAKKNSLDSVEKIKTPKNKW